MFCRNCGQKLAEGDKFCSACGTKTQIAENSAAEGFAAAAEEISPATITDDKPLFEPFDFKAFGFDFADLGLGTGVKKDEPAVEEAKPTPPTEKFDWNTGAFPDTNKTTRTEDVDFNWSLSPEVPEHKEEPEIFTPAEPVWTGAESEKTETAELEAQIFGDIENQADETRKQSEEIDKFFTFHKKNEEFQKILDREYEKVKTGNILTEEKNEADAISEEKFTARQPEDPMEELFAAEGVVKGYEPKPVETDVLERIEAAEAEKRIREEAARLAEEKKAEMAAAEAAEAVAEEIATEPAAPEMIEAEPETVEAAETAAVIEEPAETIPAVQEINFEEPAVEEVQAIDVPEEEPVVDDAPEKTKQVDKAAILAEMAIASEMVQRDREMAAAQEAVAPAAEAAPVVEDIKFEVPDFLGHHEEAAPAEEPAETVEAEAITFDIPVEEPAAVEEPAETVEAEAITFDAPVVEEILAEEPADEISVEKILTASDEETPEEPELELDIFEQLEAEESPVEEIILQEPQTIEDLFAEIPTVEEVAAEEGVTEHTVILTEDSVAEILKTVEEDTTKDDTMVFTAHALGAILAEAEQEDPDAKEVVVSLEDLTALEQQAAEGTLPELVAAKAAEEVEEVVTGGKGRTFLKICLVILVILLVIEIAGVAIKIAAPTSGAANFIDNQLNKVFQLLSDEDTADDDYNA